MHENEAALGVHCVRDLLPSGDLFRRMNARRRRIALPGRHDLRGFGDDQTASGGALRIILDSEIRRHIAGDRRAHAREGRHHHAMRERVAAKLERSEQ